MAVSTAPTSIPSTGFENLVNMLAKWASSASGATASLMASIPNIRMAKPSMIFPISFFLLSSLDDIIRMIPIAASTGEKEDGLSSCNHMLLPSIPVNDRSHDVTVVPTLAPIIIPTACDSFMIPEFTNPTTMTVVADDDCITAVTPAPKRTAKIFFDVSFSRIASSFPPAILASPSPMADIPYRKSDNPPIIDNKLKILINFTSYAFFLPTSIT